MNTFKIIDIFRLLSKERNENPDDKDIEHVVLALQLSLSQILDHKDFCLYPMMLHDNPMNVLKMLTEFGLSVKLIMVRIKDMCGLRIEWPLEEIEKIDQNEK